MLEGKKFVAVELLDDTQTVVATTTTDANGYYRFKDLPGEADYTVRFPNPDDTLPI